MLSAPSNRRERILLYGEANSGKSSAWVSLALWLRKTKSDAKVWLLDSDQAYEAMWCEELDGIVECVDIDVNEMEKWPAIMEAIKGRAGKDDWVVVDMIDKLWAGAQSYFWEQEGSGTLGNVYMRNMIDSGFNLGGDWGKNWDAINKLKDDFMWLYLNTKCHKLACTSAGTIYTDSKSGLATRADDEKYVRYKFKPRGHPRIAHEFHTILLAREIPGVRDSEWNLTTVKERGPIGMGKRVELRGEKVSPAGGFVHAYLIKVAGWRM
jgi:hypothetical protein